MKFRIFAFCIASGLLLSGCAQNMILKLDDVRNSYDFNNYSDAAEKFSGKSSIPDQDNLEILISADSLFHQNKFSESDSAYEEFNKRNLDLTGGDLTREIGILLGGNMSNDYRPYMMDALFVSYYQIWDALADGRFADARVIINQSYDRQQRMSREYEALIKDNQEKSSDNNELANRLRNENAGWAAFTDIMNPALTYLAGIYALDNGDFNDAKTYLKRANGMVPSNSFVSEDLNMAKAGKIPSNTSWVFIESGFAPKLIEDRFDMPWSVGNGVSVVSIAISEPLVFNETIYIDSAQVLADVDAMFMTEYNEYRINEALRAWTSAVSKAVLQATMYNSDSQYAGLLGLASTIYSVASTSAEVRTWATLPKKIYLLRVSKNKSGLIELKSGGNLVSSIKIPAGNNLVYVRLGQNSFDEKVIKLK
ncbi:MAG TPA: hypothetical protein PKJ33_01550 [Alphaproteobacteria bacterium]|nr:hypothetical protein [Alphaproteobacteria bacterium]